MADLIRHLILSFDNQHRMRSRGKPGMTGQRLFRQSREYIAKKYYLTTGISFNVPPSLYVWLLGKPFFPVPSIGGVK